MALSTVSQLLPKMEHLLLTKRLIWIFFLCIFYVAIGCFLAKVRYQTWFGVVQWCLKNSSSSQVRLSGPVVYIGSRGCRACLPKEYLFFFFVRCVKPQRGNNSQFPFLWQSGSILFTNQSVSSGSSQGLNMSASASPFICLT